MAPVTLPSRTWSISRRYARFLGWRFRIVRSRTLVPGSAHLSRFESLHDAIKVVNEHQGRTYASGEFPQVCHCVLQLVVRVVFARAPVARPSAVFEFECSQKPRH